MGLFTIICLLTESAWIGVGVFNCGLFASGEVPWHAEPRKGPMDGYKKSWGGGFGMEVE